MEAPCRAPPLKLYGGLRGFGDFALAGGLGDAAALTVGGEVPTSENSSVLLELTFLTNLYSGAAYLDSDPANPLLHTPQAVGFPLVPAL